MVLGRGKLTVENYRLTGISESVGRAFQSTLDIDRASKRPL